MATRLLPIVLSSTATMFFGNASYLYLSVSFIQILKVWIWAVGAVLYQAGYPLLRIGTLFIEPLNLALKPFLTITPMYSNSLLYNNSPLPSRPSLRR